MKAFLNGNTVPRDEIQISPDDRGFLLGDGVYEVIRSYGGELFRADEHLARLRRSLDEIRIEVPDLGGIEGAARNLLAENQLEEREALVYIQVTRGVAPRKHAFPDAGTTATTFVSTSSFEPRHEPLEKGIRILLVPDLRWQRCDIKAIGLLPNVLASQRAKESGADEALFLRNGVVTEGAHTSFGAILRGELVTHPLDHQVLPSITREVVLGLARELGIPIRESPVREDELTEATEMMVLSTTAEVTPVVQVDDWAVADGRPGPVTRGLQQAFRALVATLVGD